MSKRFLTIGEAYNKVGETMSGTDNPDHFIVASKLKALSSVDKTLLSKYQDTDYVIDDDIVKVQPAKEERVLYLPASGYTDGYLISQFAPFHFNKPWRTEIDFQVTSVRYGFVNILQVYRDDSNNNRAYLDIRAQGMNNASEVPQLVILLRNTNDEWTKVPMTATFKLNNRYRIKITYNGTSVTGDFTNLGSGGYEPFTVNPANLYNSSSRKGPQKAMVAGDPQWANGAGTVMYNSPIEIYGYKL